MLLNKKKNTTVDNEKTPLNPSSSTSNPAPSTTTTSSNYQLPTSSSTSTSGYQSIAQSETDDVEANTTSSTTSISNSTLKIMKTGRKVTTASNLSPMMSADKRNARNVENEVPLVSLEDSKIEDKDQR